MWQVSDLTRSGRPSDLLFLCTPNLEMGFSLMMAWKKQCKYICCTSQVNWKQTLKQTYNCNVLVYVYWQSTSPSCTLPLCVGCSELLISKNRVLKCETERVTSCLCWSHGWKEWRQWRPHPFVLIAFLTSPFWIILTNPKCLLAKAITTNLLWIELFWVGGREIVAYFESLLECMCSWNFFCGVWCFEAVAFSQNGRVRSDGGSHTWWRT